MTGSAIVRGVMVPLGIVILACFVFFVAGMRGSLGPLDLGTVNVIVIVQWVLAPVVGGLLAQTIVDGALIRAAPLLAALLGLAVAFVLLTAAGTASTTCGLAAGPSALGYVGGCLAVGAVIGSGAGASLLFTGRLARRNHWIPAVLIGGALNLVAGAGAYVLFYSIVACFR